MSNEIALSFNLDSMLPGSSSGRNFNRLKVPKNGSIVVRFLPPYGTNHQGSIQSKHTIHWGFFDAEGKARPVACSYPTERYCPVCDMVRQAQSELEEMKRTGANNQTREDQLKKTIESFNAKTFFLFNVVDFSDGEVKLLELPKTAVSGRGKQVSPNSLAGKMIEARDKRKIDSTALDSGVWFEISRNGEGLNTVYSVDFSRITKLDAEGNEVESLNKTPINEATLSKITAQLSGQNGPMYDTHAMYEARTSLELKSLMDGAPVPSKSRNEESTNESKVSTKTEETVTKTSQVTKASPAPLQSAVASTAASSGGNSTAAVQSEIQRLREKARLKAQGGA